LAANIDPNGNSVVTLLQDVTHEAMVQLPVCTIDLNDYTWSTGGANVRAIEFSEDKTTDATTTNCYAVVKNGTIDAGEAALVTDVGALRVQNVALISANEYAVVLRYGTTTNIKFQLGNWNDGNVMENCVVYSSASNALYVHTGGKGFGNVQYTIRDTVMVSGGTGALLYNDGKVSGTATVNLGSGVEFYTQGSIFNGTAQAAGTRVNKLAGENVTQVGKANSYTIDVAGNEVTGLNKWTTNEAGVSVGETVYDSVADAIDAANDAEVETVVKLNANVAETIEVLDLGPNAKLDLNGATLQISATGIVEGFVVDSTGSGLLKYTGRENFLPENNPQIPIWDAENNGYRLADVTHRQGDDEWKAGESDFTYTFRFDLDNQDWNDLLLSNQEITANGLTITAGVDVYVDTELVGNGFEISDDDCVEGETYIHRIINNAKGGYRFTLTNAQDAGEVVIQSWIKIGGVKHISGEKTYLNPNAPAEI